MKLSKIISPERFRQLATYIDVTDRQLGVPEKDREVQEDLLKFADALEKVEAEEKPIEKWNGNCRCGHTHNEHSTVGRNHNYSAGRCLHDDCFCKNFIHQSKDEQA